MEEQNQQSSISDDDFNELEAYFDELNFFKNCITGGMKAPNLIRYAEKKQECKDKLNAILQQGYSLKDVVDAFDAGEEYGKNLVYFHNTDSISKKEFEETPNKEQYINKIKK
jgi:hypothetical protein